MAKIEEITELLVNEINSFEKSIQKLETLSEKISITKIGIDIKEFKSIMESHQQKMASHTRTIERFENRFEDQLKQAKIYPTWAVVVLIISVLLNAILVLYVFFM